MGKKSSIDTFCRLLKYIDDYEIEEITNQSELAKELNIDRTTLGRYIKKLNEYNFLWDTKR